MRATTPSPATSFASSTAALNQSQNTTFTEPDHILSSFSRPTIHRLTKGEARQVRQDGIDVVIYLANTLSLESRRVETPSAAGFIQSLYKS